MEECVYKETNLQRLIYMMLYHSMWAVNHERQVWLVCIPSTSVCLAFPLPHFLCLRQALSGFAPRHAWPRRALSDPAGQPWPWQEPADCRHAARGRARGVSWHHSAGQFWRSLFQPVNEQSPTVNVRTTNAVKGAEATKGGNELFYHYWLKGSVSVYDCSH